jgi:hypothetical protein
VAVGTAGVGAGTWGVALAARSPGIARPAGFLGSKKPSGRGRVDTSSMPRAATPASRRPGFRLIRGSFGSAGFCCAMTVAMPSAKSTANIAPRTFAPRTIALISRAP